MLIKLNNWRFIYNDLTSSSSSFVYCNSSNPITRRVQERNVEVVDLNLQLFEVSRWKAHAHSYSLSIALYVEKRIQRHIMASNYCLICIGIGMESIPTMVQYRSSLVVYCWFRCRYHVVLYVRERRIVFEVTGGKSAKKVLKQ